MEDVKMTEEELKEYYRKNITEIIGNIENPTILMKIYTVAKTHLKILREKEQEV